MVPFTSRDPRSHEYLQDNHLTLTVRDRILLHLLEYIMSRSNHWVPFQVTQPGISDAVGIKPRHIQQYIRPMIVQGLVEERVSCVQRDQAVGISVNPERGTLGTPEVVLLAIEGHHPTRFFMYRIMIIPTGLGSLDSTLAWRNEC